MQKSIERKFDSFFKSKSVNILIYRLENLRTREITNIIKYLNEKYLNEKEINLIITENEYFPERLKYYFDKVLIIKKN